LEFARLVSFTYTAYAPDAMEFLVRIEVRLPGGLRNVGIWEAPDATELISGLPLFPWIDADVTALVRHPLEAD
jgi:muconolactone delta-isomerase